MIKCIILDLDDTLWKGILVEGGVLLDNMYREFQSKLLTLRSKGILLAICSKNDEQPAMDMIANHPEMILRPEHFSAVRINWMDKAHNISEIANELNIGLDSILFVDDNLRERELVRKFLPKVTVLDLDRPEDYGQALLDLESVISPLTAEDRLRGEFYTQRRSRLSAQKRATDLTEFFHSLEMAITIEEGNKLVVPRVAQLTQRVTQFNIAPRGHSEWFIEKLVGHPRWKMYTCRVKDRFGDMGIVGVALLFRGAEWLLSTFLLSCRAIGYDIETAFLGHIVQQINDRICVLPEPTDRNQMAMQFLADFGFQHTAVAQVYYPTETKILPAWIEIEEKKAVPKVCIITATLDIERGQGSLDIACEMAGISHVSYLAYHPQLHGSVKTANIGVRYALRAGVEHIAYINDDAIPEQGWLKTMVDVLESNPSYGIVVARGKCRTGPQLSTEDAGILVLDKPPALFCTVIKREVFEKVGLFDEVYTHYFCDSDFCQKTMAAGWKCVLAREVFVNHAVTTYDQSKRWWAHDWEIYKERWG